MAVHKTNAARLLDDLHLPYTLHSVAVNADHLSAVDMAENLGVSPGEVFKTLVAEGTASSSGSNARNILMACIPADAELDLKALAVASGHKSVRLVPLKDVFPLTGYVRGGCSPLAARKAYAVYVDESAILHEQIFVSAGQRGVQLLLAPDALLAAVRGTYAALTRQDT